MKIGINGFGRIGRLVFRQLFERTDLPGGCELVQINDPGGDARRAAYLAEFDSVHGRWSVPVEDDGEDLLVAGRRVRFTRGADPVAADWPADLDVLLECSGRYKTAADLAPYLERGIGHVLVSAPVGDASVPNVVVGINDDAFDPARDRIVSGASCTTNCVAPVVRVLDATFGIVRGSINTIHAVTASQKVMDGFSSDLRRGRAASASLIPTTTGAAKAVVRIFPELDGHLSGLAVRVPVTCPSITDCTFELRTATDAEAVNAALQSAAEGELAGILGYETRPLVSIDYVGDARSSIVDAPSTLVVDGHHVKVLAWYDNETGYSHRLVDLLRRIGA
ncbi:MAG TPA: glyceraldehyde 3-phosphate dehydrogenase NAD-binding domain-containing protein [Pseudomonadales bacterium]|nr:glyceraldehyde 3-phosphate dehydrogenase NAD-binding domain-containing protein [Pseudomonadales bacterium]